MRVVDGRIAAIGKAGNPDTQAGVTILIGPSTEIIAGEGRILTAGGFDDPDAYYYENYKCGASRNYTDYCNEETDKLIDMQSQELDRGKRIKLVWEIQRRLEADVARPVAPREAAVKRSQG